MPITIFDLAQHRLGFPPHDAFELELAGVCALGACIDCGKPLWAGCAFPGRCGFWICRDCVRDETGFVSVEEANKVIFGSTRVGVMFGLN